MIKNKSIIITLPRQRMKIARELLGQGVKVGDKIELSQLIACQILQTIEIELSCDSCNKDYFYTKHKLGARPYLENRCPDCELLHRNKKFITKSVPIKIKYTQIDEDTIPYTYLIGWSKINKWYYGVRYAKGCNPSDFWNPYKTSSKYVKNYISEYGEPDILMIRKTFNSIKSARNWEHKVLRRMKVIYREDFINKTDNKSIDPAKALHGWSEESRKKASVSHTGRITGEKRRENLRKSHINRNYYWMNKPRPHQHTEFLYGGNPNAKKVKYDGVIYDSYKTMTKETGLSQYIINKLILENKAERIY